MSLAKYCCLLKLKIFGPFQTFGPAMLPSSSGDRNHGSRIFSGQTLFALYQTLSHKHVIAKYYNKSSDKLQNPGGVKRLLSLYNLSYVQDTAYSLE